MIRTIWGKGDGLGISGFEVNWGAVNRGFTVVPVVGTLLPATQTNVRSGTNVVPVVGTLLPVTQRDVRSGTNLVPVVGTLLPGSCHLN